MQSSEPIKTRIWYMRSMRSEGKKLCKWVKPQEMPITVVLIHHHHLRVTWLIRSQLTLGNIRVLVYTKTVDSVKRARWLAPQTPNILCYLPPSNSAKMVSRFASVTSEEIIQINFLWCILSHCFSIYYNNYSPQCWWLALDIYLGASRLGKYPSLATSTSVNNC